jgi:hypothetical protein
MTMTEPFSNIVLEMLLFKVHVEGCSCCVSVAPSLGRQEAERFFLICPIIRHFDHSFPIDSFPIGRVVKEFRLSVMKLYQGS